MAYHQYYGLLQPNHITPHKYCRFLHTSKLSRHGSWNKVSCVISWFDRNRYEYLWADGKDVKKPIKVSASEYMDYLLPWVRSHLEDETIFPVHDEQPFPKNFKSIVKTIFKRLFRVYAHIYYSHAQEIIDLGVDAHLNTTFKHFFLFIQEFDLVEPKEMAPLAERIQKINSQYGIATKMESGDD
eukprot:TRINITY_DN7444_c0_g1_i2.p1 TRINITY_DN7444_c0_g1~~TRINITY_DN7444_c0_g1_i2.p1  ORF type:complete len:184 (-),score=30.96 TRINITY_DN7444_c0_g1_i2:68-619(-)